MATQTFKSFVLGTLIYALSLFLILPISKTFALNGPSLAPELRVETGMHTAIIRRIAVDRNCSLLVSASDDKTVRLWSLPDGKLIRTYRMPIGKGHEGKAFSVAISPDSRYVATGGWDAQYGINRKMHVYLFDTYSGRLVRRLGKFTSVINQLAFSADGQYLAAMIGRQTIRVKQPDGKYVSKETGGMRVWRTSDWKIIGIDTDYQGDSYGAVFGPDNSLYTSSYDGFIRKYSGSNFRRVAKVKGKSGKESFGIAVDPTGQKVAVGYYDKPVVDVHNASNLAYAFTPDVKGIKGGSLISVAWSQDGQRLYSGGAYWDTVSRTRPLRIWKDGGRGKAKNIPGPRTTIMGLIPCGQNLAVAGADPAFGMVSFNGRRKIFWRDRDKADMRGKDGSFFTISEDGSRLRFGLGYQDRSPVLLDIERGSLTDAPRAIRNLYKADVSSLDIKNWNDKFNPTFRGRRIKLDEYERSRTIAIRPDKQGFVLGANWSMRAYDDRGYQLWRFQTPSVVWGMNITRNGQLVVATFGDGTIRWYRLSDGKELMAFFVNAKDRRWILWTPKGYYMASPGGEDLIGWHLNQGWNQAADFFPSSRFRDRFYRPDIVKKVLELLDEDDAIEEANRLSKRKRNDEDIRKKLPPIINILNPVEGTLFSNPKASIEYSLRSPSGQKITKVDILVDGRPINSADLESYSIPKTGDIGRLNIKLPKRNVNISLIARTKFSASEAASLGLKWKGPPPRQQTVDINKPKLYALLIGVSDYANDDFKLRYAAKDAEDFAQALKLQEGGVYREVELKVLTNSQATAGNIRDALDWLEGEVTSRDVGLLFMAGHGMTDLKQRFFYLPYDGNPEKLRRTAIPQHDIQSVISSLAGKALMFVDACHSAGSFGSGTQTRGLSLVDINGIVNELSSAENGVVMFASSTGRELSIEDSRWENGAFTEALLEGFQGRADYNKNNAISVKELDLWLSERVKELTNKKQHPVARKPPTVPDFPIALAKE